MNQEQKKLLLKEKEELTEDKKRDKTMYHIGLVLVFLGIIFGYYMGFVILSLELIIGFILIIWGGVSNRLGNKKIIEIDYVLAGDDARKIKMKHKVRKYFCSKCGNEVKEMDNRCKKCKNFLAVDRAVKVKDIEVED